VAEGREEGTPLRTQRLDGSVEPTSIRRFIEGAGEGASDRQAVAIMDATSFDGSGHPCTRKIGQERSFQSADRRPTFRALVTTL